MWELGAMLTLTAVGVVSAYIVLFTRQQRRYRALEPPLPNALAADRLNVPVNLPDFQARVAVVPQVLRPELLALLREAARRCYQGVERSYVPGHKKGGTIAYASLYHRAPEMVTLYQSASLRELCSAILGMRVVPTPINDQSSCSLLVYDRPGDHIGWHFDHNFYRGRHFTLLISLVNERHGRDELSSALLITRQGDREIAVPMPPNTLILFEGARVRHKITPLGEDELRMVLSMTYCTNPAAPVLKAVARRFKDIAFFGIRALWT
jgi:hypothetical protein